MFCHLGLSTEETINLSFKGRGGKLYDTFEEASESWGRTVYRGDEGKARRKLDDKIDEEMEKDVPEESPLKALEFIISRFDIISKLVKNAGISWLRSGSRKENATLIRAWNVLASEVNTKGAISRRILKLAAKHNNGIPTEEKNGEFITSWVHVDQFNQWLERGMYPRLHTLKALTWLEEDMNVNKVYTFVEPVMMGGRNQQIDPNAATKDWKEV